VAGLPGANVRWPGGCGGVLRVCWMDRFIAHFQPIADLKSGRILGYEALARRVADDGAVDLPAAWLTELLADREQARRLGTTMIGEAAAALRALPEDVYVSINLEIADMLAENFADVRREHSLDAIAHRLVVEVAERDVLTPQAVEWAAGARALGARIALDDVGAGASRMAALVDLEPTYLKLDASITRRLEEPGVARLVRFISAGARTLGAHIIVEGVEQEAIAEAARKVGAIAGQGWHFGKPGPLPG